MLPVKTQASGLSPFSGDIHIKHYTEEELNRLTFEFQKWFQEKEYKRYRHWLIFLFLRYTGARVSEILSIDESRDIDLKDCSVRIPNLKRHNPKRKGSYKLVPVPERLLLEYLRLKTLYNPENKIRTFAVDRTTFFKIYKEVCKRALIPEDLRHPHVLRHTRAIELLRSGVPVTAVQSLLGHANLNTTAIYLKYSATEIKEILKLKGLL